MRTIRVLAAAAALTGLLAASGPASAKLMQLTLAGKGNGLFDGYNTTGACGGVPGCGFVDGYLIDFVFTYDTNITLSDGIKLLSERVELRAPDDPYNDQLPGFTPSGELLGAFNMPVSQIALIHNVQRGYYELYSAFITLPQGLDAFQIDIPGNGTNALDQVMTYYPDPNTNYSPRPYFGNSLYDLWFHHYDASGVQIVDIETGQGQHPPQMTGRSAPAMSTSRTSPRAAFPSRRPGR